MKIAHLLFNWAINARFVRVLSLVLLGLVGGSKAQTNSYLPTGKEDVVFAIALSPNGRVLGIARGVDDPVQRFGRIELWDIQTGKLLRIIKGFDGPVRSVSFSPDGQTLLSSSSEYRTERIQEKAGLRGAVFGELKWWNAESGELKHKLTLAHKDTDALPFTYRPGLEQTARAAYSPDGNQLAVAEYLAESFLEATIPETSLRFYARRVVEFTGGLKLLDARSGDLKLKLKLKSSQPIRAVFSHDGKLLATWSQWLPDKASNSDELTIWTATTGRAERTLKDFRGVPNDAAFSRDGRLLAVASTKFSKRKRGLATEIIASSDVKVFDVHTWQTRIWLKKLSAVNSLTFTADSNDLLIGCLVNKQGVAVPGLKRVNLQHGDATDLPTGGDDFSTAVDLLTLSRSGDLLAFRSGISTVRLMDLQTGRVKHSWDDKTAGVEKPMSRFLLTLSRIVAVAFSTDGNTLLGQLEGGEVKLWDQRTGEVKKELPAQEDVPSLVAIAADAKTIAEVGDGTLRVSNVSDETKRILTIPGGKPISAIALSADGEMLAVADGNGLQLLNVTTGAVSARLPRRQTVVHRLEFSNDGRSLAAADEEGAIQIWDLVNSRVEATRYVGSAVTALRFSPDGQTLASATYDRSIDLWNPHSGGLHRKLQKHTAAINALAFSADGRWLASGSDDRTVIIWNTALGKSHRTLKGHDQTVSSLAFSPDGSVLASAGGNSAVVLWELRTGKVNRVLR